MDNSTVLLVTEVSGRWSIDAVTRRPWDNARVRVRAMRLDAELAAGRSADTDRLRAVRAATLVAPAVRGELAESWQRLLERADHPRSASRQVPIARAGILGAESEIRELIGALTRRVPVPARGVAMACLLLVDGAGPVYNPSCGIDLGAAVHEAVRHLDPGIDLMPTRTAS
jgi:hypothetical protein